MNGARCIRLISPIICAPMASRSSSRRMIETARLSAVPESIVAQFSKRTMGGSEAARAYARSQGLDREALTPARKIALLKSGVQNPREGKSDDVSDLAAWRETAARLGYEHRSVLRPRDIVPLPSREQRLETAFQAALPLLGKQFDRRAVIDGADARIAAAKGLIAAGIGEEKRCGRHHPRLSRAWRSTPG